MMNRQIRSTITAAITRRSVRFAVGVVTLLVALVAVSAAAQTSHKEASPFEQLKWRFIGPNGNRVASVAGAPGNPMVAYAGAASGGIWKTENGGVSWTPVF